jgi:hypothetical protein
MNEGCPVCREVLSEINGINGTEYGDLAELPWRTFVLTSPVLHEMFDDAAMHHVADRKHHIAAGFSDLGDACGFFVPKGCPSGRRKVNRFGLPWQRGQE